MGMLWPAASPVDDNLGMGEPGVVKVYGNRRMAALLGVGFASGLPYVLITDGLAAWLSGIGVNVKQIGLFALIGLPYVLKFLWAPLLDRFSPPGFRGLGRRRGWLVLSQGLLAIALALIAWAGPANPGDALWPLAVLGVALVLASSTQDIVADAYRADVLQPHEFGAGAAVFVTGYRLAMILGGALALIVADDVGWPMVFVFFASLMALNVVMTIAAPEPQQFGGHAPQSMREAIVEPVRQLILARGFATAMALVGFILVFRLPDFMGNRMTMPLLLQHLKFTEDQVGWIRQLLGFFITIAGALIGGSVVARIGFMRALVIFGVAQALSNAGLLALAAWGSSSLAQLAFVIAIESFCGGLVAAGFVAFLMSCCDWRYSATQYAIFTALSALAQTMAGTFSGFLVDEFGYANFFVITIAAGVPGLMMLPLLAGVTRHNETLVEIPQQAQLPSA
jgi:MFS transporter, PAT family, beta-lactamase induction signal transducer AmpG